MYPDVKKWQARRESNPQPAVLETAALPIELLAFKVTPALAGQSAPNQPTCREPQCRSYLAFLAPISTHADTFFTKTRRELYRPHHVHLGAFTTPL